MKNSTNRTITENAETTQADLYATVMQGAPEMVSTEWADARALDYVMTSGCCVTCMVDGEDPQATEDELAALDACPTCGVRSVEWMQAAEIDARVSEEVGYIAIERAIERA